MSNQYFSQRLHEVLETFSTAGITSEAIVASILPMVVVELRIQNLISLLSAECGVYLNPQEREDVKAEILTTLGITDPGSQ